MRCFVGGAAENPRRNATHATGRARSNGPEVTFNPLVVGSSPTAPTLDKPHCDGDSAGRRPACSAAGVAHGPFAGHSAPAGTQRLGDLASGVTLPIGRDVGVAVQRK
jgi:hypothetical protein